jgi:cytochrome c553
MKKVFIVLALVIVAMGTGCSTTKERSRNLADPSVSGKTLAQQVCSNCHGMDGQAVNPNFPNLAGQQPAYFIAQLKSFQSHNRLDPAGFEYMWGLSRSLTDAQIRELAAYYEAQTSVAPGSAGESALVAEGRVIFENGIPETAVSPCSVCHGIEGQGNGQFPRLSHQHADYLIKQLMVFQRTDERPEGSIMKTVAHGLTSQNMKAVAAYLQEFPVP